LIFQRFFPMIFVWEEEKTNDTTAPMDDFPVYEDEVI
jgi:hypothetical protein